MVKGRARARLAAMLIALAARIVPGADAGAALFAEMVAGALGRVRRWQPDHNGMLR